MTTCSRCRATRRKIIRAVAPAKVVDTLVERVAWVTPDEVIAEARSWVGVPFMHQGRSRQGVDCVGLAIVVGQKLQLIPPNFERRDYGRLPSRGELAQKIQQHCKPLSAPTPGCLLAMRWNTETAHVAICTGDNLIHSYERIGRVVEHGFRGPWLKFVDSVWALPGVKYE